MATEETIGEPDGFSHLPEDAVLGISEFNRGRFYECHEHLEDAWRREAGEIRLLYQGILQIGVGFYHLENDNRNGALNLMKRGTGRLENLSPDLKHGLDLQQLILKTKLCLTEVEKLKATELHRFDRAMIPRITLENGEVISVSEAP